MSDETRDEQDKWFAAQAHETNAAARGLGESGDAVMGTCPVDPPRWGGDNVARVRAELMRRVARLDVAVERRSRLRVNVLGVLFAAAMVGTLAYANVAKRNLRE